MATRRRKNAAAVAMARARWRGVQFALAWASARFWRRTDLPTAQALTEAGFVC